jgi:hypothetical protein
MTLSREKMGIANFISACLLPKLRTAITFNTFSEKFDPHPPPKKKKSDFFLFCVCAVYSKLEMSLPMGIHM